MTEPTGPHAMLAGPVVKLDGLLGRRAELAARQLDSDTPYSVDLLLQDVVLDPVRRRECDDYSGDLSGRWLEAAVFARQLSFSVDESKQDAVLRGVLDAQNRDGSFGPGRGWADTDHGAVWGNGRLLMGLLAQRARVTAGHALHTRLHRAIDELTGHLITVTPLWLRWFEALENRYGKFALDLFSILQPLAMIAGETPSDGLTVAVGALAEAVPLTTDHPYHTHGYLLALRGALLWYGDTGDLAGVRAVYRAYQRVGRTALTPQGTTKETLALLGNVNTEGCGVADWLMLTLELHDRLGYEHLLMEAGHVAANGLPHVQAPSGHFGCETITADPGMLTADYAPEAWWCCTLHCLLAIAEFAHRAVVVRDDGVHVHFLHAIISDVTTGAGDIRVQVTGDFPWTAEAGIRVTGAPDSLRLVAHVPAGYRLDGDSALSYANGTVTLPVGTDSLDLGLEPLTWVASGTNRFEAAVPSTTDNAHPLLGKRVAVFEGALLMAADAGLNRTKDVVRARRIELKEREGSFVSLSAADGSWRARAYGHLIPLDLELRPLVLSHGADNELVRVEFDELVIVGDDSRT